MHIATWLYNALTPASWHTPEPFQATGSASYPAGVSRPVATGPIQLDAIPFPGSAFGLTAHNGKPSETINYLMFNSGRNHVTSKLSRYCNHLQEELKKPHSGFIVLRNADKKIVGTAAILNKGKDAHIVMVHVDANQRRRGLARWMMQTLTAHAQDRGFESVTLNVRNPNAIALYRSLDFTATGQTDVIDGKSYLFMQRSCRPVHSKTMLLSSPPSEAKPTDDSVGLLRRNCYV